MPNHSIQCSWAEAKRVLAAAYGGSSSREIKAWADRLNGDGASASAFAELNDFALAAVSSGDGGICRYRFIPLHQHLGECSPISYEITFGEVYVVKNVSASGRWLEIACRHGRSGWIPRDKHFSLSQAALRSLWRAPKSDQLNFLIEAIHRG
jgi:hypothetical protein